MRNASARDCLRSIAKAYEIDRFLGTVHLVRNARELMRVIMFADGKFDHKFVEIVAEAATMDFLGDYSERGFGQKSISEEERRAYETLSRLRLGLDVTEFAIEFAYKALCKYNSVFQTMLFGEAAKRAENVSTVNDAKDNWLQLARDAAEAERKLLRYIDCQMSRMNYEHAAVCMINWLPELEKMTGYVSRETSLAFKYAR